MSFITKHTWKGLTVAAAVLLSVGLMTQAAFAAVTSVTPANTTVSLTTNAATGTPAAYTTLANDIVIASNNGPADFPAGVITFTAPTGWRFNTAVSPLTVTGGGGTCGTPAAAAAGGVVTASTITVTITTAAVGTACTLTIDTNGPLLIQPLTASSVSGAITTTGATWTGVNAGTIAPGTPCTVSCITITATTPNVASDGTTSSTLTFFPKDAAGVGLSNTVVTATTSRGTLSVSSSTTSTLTCTTAAGTSCTLTFRGNGSTGTANIVATTGAPNEGSGQINLEVVSTNQNPTAIKFRDNTNSGHIAANTTSVYTSPTLVSRVRFQVTNGSGDGVNNELLQATVDKGYIIVGDAAACASNTSDTATTGTVAIDGTNTDGIGTFTVCARSGQVGAIKVTVKNLSTSMTDATTTVTSAGAPNKLETTVVGGSVTVTVKDKDGNEVADGTTVSAVTPAFSGAVSPACGTTSNGKVSFSAAASGASTQVVITVFMNDSGSGAAGTCAALGPVAAAAITVNLGGGVGPAPTPGTGGGFTGAAPARGSIGLLVTNGPSTAAGLVTALGTAGCSVESLAVLETGTWKIYINGAPAVVNSAFPGTVATTVAFFVRCAA